MNINIAFNTIIYIMVFLFPGMLLRRTFFSGSLSKHFENGNNFERIMWTLLLSVFSIFLFCTLICVFDSYTNDYVSKFFELNPQIYLDNFIGIYKNEFPDLLQKPESLKNVFSTLFSLYCFSAILGTLINQLIKISGYEYSLSFLNPYHKWKTLVNSNSKNNKDGYKFGYTYYTRVDVKTNEGDLFTGELHDFLLDKDDNINAITIQEAYKFYTLSKITDQDKITEIKELITEDNTYILFHSESVSEYVYKKRIKGNIFSIISDNIMNVSVTYIKIATLDDKFRKFANLLITISLLFVVIFSIIVGIWDLHIIEFDSFFKRIAFCIVLPFSTMFLYVFFISILETKLFRSNKNKYYFEIITSFLMLILFLIPYLYVFSFITFGSLILIIFGSLIVISLADTQLKKFFTTT